MLISAKVGVLFFCFFNYYYYFLKKEGINYSFVHLFIYLFIDTWKKTEEIAMLDLLLKWVGLESQGPPV